MKRAAIQKIHNAADIKISITDILPKTCRQLLITQYKLGQHQIANNGKIGLTIIPQATLFRRTRRHQKRKFLRGALCCGHNRASEEQQVISSACSIDQASESMSYPRNPFL